MKLLPLLIVPQLLSGIFCLPTSQEQGCSSYIDLVIVVESSNITSFSSNGKETWHPAILLFLSGLFRGLHLGSESFRVAVVLFSTSVDDIMTFTVDREFAEHGISFLRPNFGNAKIYKGLEEMNRIFEYYSRPEVTKRALLITGSHLDDSAVTLSEVWKARMLNVDLLAIGFGGNITADELRQIASDFVVTIGDIGMLYALVDRVLQRICINPVHGIWSTWMSWSPCTRSCNGGYRTRSRACNEPRPALGGRLCEGDPTQTLICNTYRCQENWKDAVWSQWGDCSRSCGQGRQVRSRLCTHIRCSDVGVETDVRPCSKSACPAPVNGDWTEWSKWTSCDCNTHTRSRHRECNKPKPSHGGKPCDGLTEFTLACNVQEDNCPKDGGWSSWSAWSKCSVSCDSGISTRTRTCDQPRPERGGAKCAGTNTEQYTCNTAVSCQRCKMIESNFGKEWYALNVSNILIPQRCSNGQIFSIGHCKCITKDTRHMEDQGCNLLFHLSNKQRPGQNSTTHSNDKTVYNNVQFNSQGGAIFHKNSSVVLWSIYNTNWHSDFYISTRVKPINMKNFTQTLLSDGDCTKNRTSSVRIAIHPVGEQSVKVIFGISFNNKNWMSYINVTVEVNEILNLGFSIKQNTIGGEVNGKMTKILLQKDLFHSWRGPLVVGKNMCSSTKDGFEGTIEDLQVHKC